MYLIENSNSLQFHYYFKDNSHSIDAILRNECEKEILHIFNDISETLGLELNLETLPTEEGGFKDTWKFIGKNAAQITLIVSIAAVIILRFPAENEELTKLQIENLKLDNELKKRELAKLNLEFLQASEEISQKTLVDSIELVNKNYKISWRKSNLYKKLNTYKKIESIEVLRLKKDKPVGKPRKIPSNTFTKFVLRTDELPILEVDNAIIDVISPAIKKGKFKWKGFCNNEIINFIMNDLKFKDQVLKGDIHFSNKFSIEVQISHSRKINQDGNIKITNSVVNKVISIIKNGKKDLY